jgi:hypothetical protein
MIYDGSMAPDGLTAGQQSPEVTAEYLDALKKLDELRGIFKHSGMTEELIRDRREEHRKEEEKWRSNP